MRKSLIATVLAALCCCGAVQAALPAGADAVEYVHDVNVTSGNNYFGPFVELITAETVGLGSALGCAGIRGVSGVVCETSTGERVAVSLSSRIDSEPYIHNHSTFTGPFDGFYS